MYLAFLAQASPQSGSGILGILPIIFIMVVVYFLMLRPQMKKQKEHARMVAELRRGDDIVTAGGLHGKIVQAYEKESTIQVQIAKGVIVTVERTSVARKSSGSGAGDERSDRADDRKALRGTPFRGKPDASNPNPEAGSDSASAVVTPSGYAATDSREGVTDIFNEGNTRKSRHRRPRRRKSSHPINRESSPGGGIEEQPT
jgi:preprotein translocase subunit YajC